MAPASAPKAGWANARGSSTLSSSAPPCEGDTLPDEKKTAPKKPAASAPAGAPTTASPPTEPALKPKEPTEASEPVTEGQSEDEFVRTALPLD
jgi:hypothetical protein